MELPQILKKTESRLFSSINNDGNLGTSMLGGQITSRFLPKLLKCEVNSSKHVRRIRRGLGNKGYVRCDAYYMIFFNA